MNQLHTTPIWQPSFSKWRHGGWYVHNVRYPSGVLYAICVRLINNLHIRRVMPRQGQSTKFPNNSTRKVHE